MSPALAFSGSAPHASPSLRRAYSDISCTLRLSGPELQRRWLGIDLLVMGKQTIVEHHWLRSMSSLVFPTNARACREIARCSDANASRVGVKGCVGSMKDGTGGGEAIGPARRLMCWFQASTVYSIPTRSSLGRFNRARRQGLAHHHKNSSWTQLDCWKAEASHRSFTAWSLNPAHPSEVVSS